MRRSDRQKKVQLWLAQLERSKFQNSIEDSVWWAQCKNKPEYSWEYNRQAMSAMRERRREEERRDLIPVLYVRDLDWYVSIEDFWGKYEPGFPRPYLVSRTGWVTRRPKWMPKKDITHRLYKRGVGMYGITSINADS